MPRPSNTTERRSQIVQAFLQAMAACGYEGATTGAIAKAAGLSPGLIHYHFRNKQEILLEAIAELTRVLETRYTERAKHARTESARLEAFVEARLASGEDADAGAVAAWVMIGAEAVRQPEVKRAYVAAMAKQRKVFLRLLRDVAGERLNSRELGHLAAAMLALMEGAFQLSVSAERIMPRNYAAATVMRLIESYLAMAGRPRPA